MFATILGALPRPPDAPTDDDEAVREALAIQELAGLEPLSDGGVRWPSAAALAEAILAGPGTATVDAWRFAAGCTTRAVKQALPGPCTIGRGSAEDAFVLREAATLVAAEALNEEIRGLIAAGCPLIEIEEPAATRIGDDDAERRLFREAHRRVTAGIDGVHLSLAIGGGNADMVGAATILDAPYASYAFDLIAGPDNWRLIADVPHERGVICGAMSPQGGSDDGPELLVWAAHYAASTGRRGIDRVGLANAPGLERLDWAAVEGKLVRLGDAARLASREGMSELAGALDPRAISSRSAAAGRFVPRKRRPASAEDAAQPD